MSERVDFTGGLPSQDVEGISSPEIEKRHLLFAIMGVPASGKSTLAESLGESEFQIIQEVPVLKVPNFGDYYSGHSNPERFFKVQLFFLTRKYSRIKEAKKLQKNGSVIVEPPPWTDRIFAQARLETHKEIWSLYQGIYDSLFPRDDEGGFKPDFVYYLRLPFDSMLERIKRRAKRDESRKPELNESPEYWERVWRLNEQWVRDNSKNFKICTINTDFQDFKRFRNEEKGKEALVKEFYDQTRYFLIDPRTESPRISSDIIIPDSVVNHKPENIPLIDRFPEARRGL